MFYHKGENMRSNISTGKAFFISVLMDILVKNLDDWLGCLVVLAQGHEVLNSPPIILKNTVELDQAVKNKAWVALYVSNNIEEPVKYCLGNFLLRSVIKGFSLFGLVGLQEITDALCSALADDLLLFQS